MIEECIEQKISIRIYYHSRRKPFLPDDYIGNGISPVDVRMIGQYSMLQ